MQLLRAEIERIRSICYRWYMMMFRREIVTAEGISFSMISDNNKSISINNSMDKPQKQRGWVREEMVVLVAEYFRTRDLTAQEIRDSVRFVSEVLRKRAMKHNGFVSDTFRNLNGIQMQMACIVKYDSEAQKRGSSSLSNGSKLMENIVHEYLDNPDRIKAEAYDVICQYTDDFRIK